MDTNFAPPTREVAQRQMARLLRAFEEATGLPQTVIGKIARDDTKWLREFGKRDFLFGTFDQVNSRISAVWPDGVAWPEDVPRQAPAPIGPEGQNAKQIGDRMVLPFEYAERVREHMAAREKPSAA